ncbi:MAG: DUF11 domain-containing protein [Planctomycetia bacterium]|nr:DUF11 domain-containing protein [Planctomycetia bacterium]
MSPCDTCFPPRAHARRRATRKPSCRGRREQAVVAGAEWLESRLALAIVTPFTEVFSANLTGNITFASNTLMTSPASGGQTAIDARQGIGPDQVLNDDFWNMAYVDVDSDGATFNSSSADLVVPSGAVVEFARLYWGGRAANTVPNSLLETVKFKVGAGAYSTLTGSLVGKVIGGVSNRPDNPQTYQSYGWSLVVAYSAPGTPGEVPRNLTVFQGFADVSNDSLADRNVTIPYSGFQAPQTGPVNATLGFVTYEGDLGIAGDQAYFKSQSSASETLLADAPAIPPNNFFNSTISNRGLLVTSKNPDYVNQFGFDADLVTADGIIQNGDTAAQIRVTSTQDQYYPGVITSAIDIYQPGISVTKTVEDLNGGVVDPGDTLRYTVQVSNAAGLFDGATNVVLDDLIPGNTTYVPGSLEITAGANAGPKTDPLDADQAEFTGAAVRFRLGAGATGTPTVQGGTLAPGESTTVRFRVQVNPAIIGGTTITNTAVVSYRSQTFDVPDKKLGTVSIDCPAVDLAITKGGDVAVVTAGDGVNHTYTITVKNTSSSAANNVVVADTWPAGFVPGTIVPGVGSVTGPDPVTGNFTWTIGTLAGMSSATLTAQYTVPASTPASTKTNKVVVTTSTYERNPENNTATFDTTVVTNAVLAITKTAKEPTVTAGQGGYTYTLTVSNTGPSDATNVNVVDTLPGGFTATAFNPAAGVLPVSPTSGPFTWTIGTVAAGTTKVLEVTYAVAAGVPAGPATNTADVRIGEQVQGTATATVTVGLVGDLGIEKTGPATAIPGTAISYTFVVTNGGPSDVVDALVNDALPAGIVNASWNATYSPGSSGPAAGTGSLAGVLVTLLAGGTGTFTITGSIDPLATGVLVNTSTVSPPEGVTDPNPGNETSTVTTQLVPTADLAAAKQRTSATPTAGSPVTYEIVVTNLGPSSVTSFGIVDVTTPALVGAGTSVDRGTYDPLTGVWTAAAGDSLGSGGTVTFTLSGTIPAGATGTLTNTVTVSPPAGVTDPNPDNNTATVTDPIAAISSLTIVKTGDITYKAGGFLAFQVVVTNRGPSFATGVRVVDALPSGVVNWSWQVTYVGVGSQTTDGSPDSVTASAAGIDKLMNLAVNGTATFTITALTQTGFTSDISNTAQASIGGTTVSSTWTSAFDGPINPESDLPGLVLGSDDGCNGEPFVRLVDPETGDITGAFLAYEASFRGSVRVATGDVTGDGIAEIIVGPGRNRVGEIRVFTPQGVELPAFRTLPFGSRYRGGVEVAVGDVNGDGIGDIVAGMSSGIGRVSVFLVDPTAADPVASTPFRTFRGAPGSYRGGVMIAAGDVGSFASGTLQSAAADGRAEIIVGLNAGRAALVRVFDVAGSPRVVQTIRPFGGGFSGGVTLSTALYESATVSSILVGAGRGGNSVVEVYDGQTGGQVARLQAFASFAKPNAAVFAAALDLDGDGVVNDVYGVQGRAGGGGTRGVKQFDRATSVTSTLTDAAVLVPPMRIAPIVLRVLT